MLLAAAVLPTACDRELVQVEEFAAQVPADNDADAGTWALVPNGPVTSITQVALAAPAATTSDAYQQELADIKAEQARLTSAQRKAVAYWNAGGVLRWNRFMRELVARYALAPAPALDGTYPVPDSENPFSDPVFPFSNPPYSARAYSYVSVAQYEALKMAWHYKYLYNRPAPSQVDAGVQALVPDTGLPAYPSEDAVLSAVTAELLKVLFPTAVDEITKMAAEQRNAARWAGKAAPSDISAGLAFGKSVAALFTARAAGDGMRNAVGTKAQWAVLADTARNHLIKAGRSVEGEIFWQSLDGPPRPPMLPFFGNVRPWIQTNVQLNALRPGPPPSTSSPEMTEELEEVRYYSENPTRERYRIVHSWADGAGTYTPPGHWNDIAAEYIYDARFSEVRAARAFALLNMALHNAAVGCWETKYYYYNPRPSQLDPAIKTLTGLPNFPSYPSGHSTFSAAAAEVLSYLFPAGAADFAAWRDEASLSRLYGAIHYRTDTEVGKTHGQSIGAVAVQFAGTDGAD